jgi:hypothetical protein
MLLCLRNLCGGYSIELDSGTLIDSA